MSADPGSLRVIGRWLTRLAEQTSHPTPPTTEALDDLAELLARDLPSAAFNTESLHAVLDGCGKWMPKFAEVRAAVGEHWRCHAPASARQGQAQPHAGGSSGLLSAMDHRWLNFYHQRMAELADKPDPLWLSPDPAVRVQSHRGNLESLVRARSPRAWAVISGVSEQAEGAAQGHSLEEVQAVAATMAAFLAGRSGSGRGGPPPPWLARDVSAKGEYLARLRAGAGVQTAPPRPPPAPPPEPAAPLPEDEGAEPWPAAGEDEAEAGP